MAQFPSTLSKYALDKASDVSFRPRRLVTRIEEDEDDTIDFVRVWDVTRLIFWALLDAAGSEEIETEEGNRRTPNLEKDHANYAGQIALLWFLDPSSRRDLRSKFNEPGLDPIIAAYHLFTRNGGMPAVIDSSHRDLVQAMADEGNGEKLFLTFWITEFMVRAHSIDPDKCRLVRAKYFAKRKFEMKFSQAISDSSVEKTWSMYKRSAPYIFSLFRYYTRVIRKIQTQYGFMELMSRFSNKRRMARILGRAALAADILKSRNVKQVQRADFKVVERSRTKVRPFSPDELDIINSYDPNAAIE